MREVEDIVYFEFPKDFDIEFHNILPSKIMNNNLINKYIIFKKVKIDYKLSEMHAYRNLTRSMKPTSRPVTSGVSPGLILGPNYLISFLMTLKKFADDKNLGVWWLIHQTIGLSFRGALTVVKWANRNLMKFNKGS